MNKKMIGFVLVVSFLSLILTGCSSDQKQAAKIQETIVESTMFENDFITKQMALHETKKDAQSLYNDLISLTIHDTDTLNEKLKEANKLTEKQQTLLEEAEEVFEVAYTKFLAIEDHIEKMKDEKQIEQASELLTIMNERKNSIDSFFKEYQENLDTQQTFYENLENGNFSLITLDKQVHEINEHNEEMAECMEQFNQSTKLYREIKNNYYQMN